MSSGFLFNPGAPDIWRANALLNGVAKKHEVDAYEGTLSIKTVLSGKAIWETPEGRYAIDPDTFLILNEGQSYRLHIDSDTPVETLCVFLSPATCRDLQTPGFYERKRLKTLELTNALSRLRNLGRNGSSQSLAAGDALAEIGNLLLAEEEIGRREQESLVYTSADTREEIFRLLNVARDYMLSNLQHPLRLEEIAATACLSPFHFHRLHRQAFRETPHQFVTRARMSQARRLLKNGSEVAEVSLSLGFESVPTFTRTFKQRFGITPGAFARSDN